VLTVPVTGLNWKLVRAGGGSNSVEGISVAAGLSLDLTDHFVAEYRRLEKELGELQGKGPGEDVESLKRQLEALKGQVHALEGQLEASKGQVEASKSQVEALKGQVTTLNGKVAAAEARAADSQRDCEEARRRKATADGELARLQAGLDGLGAAGVGKDAQVRQAQAKIAELQKRIKELEERPSDRVTSERRGTDEDLIRSLTLDLDTCKEEHRVLHKKYLKLESLARKLRDGLEGLKGLLQIQMEPATLVRTFQEELDRLTQGP
jgi:chromosome segregation ATPase